MADKVLHKIEYFKAIDTSIIIPSLYEVMQDSCIVTVGVIDKIMLALLKLPSFDWNK